MNTKNEADRGAVAGQVERSVRPRVWMVRRHDAPNYWIPFLHEPVDALKDPEREVVRLHWPEDIHAERERCLRIVRAVNNYDNPMTANDCADMISSGREYGEY